MNYQKIYNDFIADRLLKQPVKPTYFEKHHIIPKSMGGSDDNSNLIRLTASDHLFAHLLLAKIYGGKMWNAVVAMTALISENTGKYRVFGKRYIFEKARIETANYHRKLFSGSGSPQSDKTKYNLFHHDGRMAYGDRFELAEQTGLSRQLISGLLLGAKKTSKGWYCKEYNPKGLTGSQLTSIGIRSNTIYHLYHHDGREWSGTKVEFKEQFNKPLEFSENRKTVNGWCKTKKEAENYLSNVKARALNATKKRGSVSGKNNPMFGLDRRKPFFVKLKNKNGMEYEGCLTKFADLFHISGKEQYSTLRKMAKGVSAIKSYKGWFVVC